VFLFCLPDKVLKHSPTYSFSCTIRHDEIGDFRYVQKGWHGAVLAEHPKSYDLAIFVLGNNSRISCRHSEKDVKKLIRDFAFRIGRKGMLYVVIENVDDRFTVLNRNRFKPVIHLSHPCSDP